MKIWVDGNWYTLPHKILVVYLEDVDKENIKNMHSDCRIFCQFDEKLFDTSNVIKLLKKLRKEGDEK